MTCPVCLRDRPVIARGLCNACYQRWLKTGSTEYKRWGKHTVCSIKDCGKQVVSHGLCDMHRQRFLHHGHTDTIRPDDWGAKGWGREKKHPLYNAWKHLRRTKREMVPEWADFLQFVTDVGDRPERHRLYVADDTKPIGPTNFVWKKSITQKVKGEDERTYHNRVDKIYRVVRREGYIGNELKKHYGLTRQQYEELSEKQDHKCAICGEPEGNVIRGKVLSLAVDHDHATGKIRGLLCASCNTALGLLKDNPDLFHRAIDYLNGA